jgi:hypothetical protein
MVDLRDFGFCPVEYWIKKCRKCSKEFTADKRAWNCEDCALILSREYVPEKPLNHPLPGCFYRRHTGQLVYVIARAHLYENPSDEQEQVIFCNNSAKDKRYWVTSVKDWNGYWDLEKKILKWTLEK